MSCWFTGGDLKAEIAKQDIAKYYPALSWHCLLGGYGTYPDDAKIKPAEDGLALADMAKIDAFVAGCAQNFPSHDDALFQLKG